MNAKTTLTQWLADGDLERTLLGLEVAQAQQGAKQDDHLVFQKSRYNTLKSSHLKGIVSHADYSLELAKIREAVLEMVNRVPEHWSAAGLDAVASSGLKSSLPVNKPLPWWKKWEVVLMILAALAGVTGYTMKDFLGKKSSNAAQLTVYVQDTEGKPIPELQNKGQIIVRFGHDLRDPVIGENGRTNIGGIPTEFLGKEVEVVLVAEGWESASPGKKYNMDGEQIYLTVKRDNSLGTIQGIVQTRDGSAFIAGALVMVDHDTTVRTDSLGRFRLVLPEKMHRTEYLLTVKKAGFTDANEMYRPKTTPADIRLEK